MIGIPSDTDKCPNLLVKAIADHLNTGVFIDGTRATTLRAMLVDESLLAEVLEELRLAIATVPVHPYRERSLSLG